MSISKTKCLLPKDLLDNFYTIYSPHVVDNILRSFDIRRKTTFRINSLKTREGDVINEFREKGIKLSRCSWYNKGFIVKNSRENEIVSLKCYEEGKIYVQNLSSIIYDGRSVGEKFNERFDRILVYLTCTIFVEENEEVIDWFINKYSDIKIVDINIYLRNDFHGLTEYKGKFLAKDVRKSLRIIPDEEMEGFYICKLRKA